LKILDLYIFKSYLKTLATFERFFLGGDGMGMYNLDGRENIPLRGYPNQSLSRITLTWNLDRKFT